MSLLLEDQEQTGKSNYDAAVVVIGDAIEIGPRWTSLAREVQYLTRRIGEGLSEVHWQCSI